MRRGEEEIMATVRYFNALLQVVMNDQLVLFEELPDRETLLRSVFEQGLFIPQGEVDKDSGWGIGNARFITKDENWLFGFLHKVIDASNISTLPLSASSLNEVQHLAGYIVNKTPFFFDFSNQHLYTQSHWLISRASKSTSGIWKQMLTFALQRYVRSLDVQSIPEESGFWEQMNKLKYVNTAEFELFGPNILNDERIRELMSDFNPTDTDGIVLVLKNFFKGLKTDTEEFRALLRYILKGGGKGIFKGIDRQTDKRRTVKTESKLQAFVVSKKLDENSNDLQALKVLEEITGREIKNL